MRRREFITILGGAAAAWPLIAHGQQANKIPTVGVLWHAGSAEEEGPNFKALIEGFNAIGYVDSQNIRLEHRFPNEAPDKFKSMAAELVAMKVDVLVSVGTAAAPYAKNATTTIPVVMTVAPDPVTLKLVDSLATPGGNVTGLTIFASELAAKCLQLLKDTIPSLSRIALLVNPNTLLARSYARDSQAAAAKLGITLQAFEVRSLDEMKPSFDKIRGAKMQAVSVMADSLFFQARATFPKLALTHHLPTCVTQREFVKLGALMSYGPDILAIIRRTAVYVDKILKGAKPGELPVEQPTKLQFAVNLMTAKALGLTIPPTLLATADEVIE